MPTPPHPPARGSVASPYGARADPEDSHTPGRITRASATFAGTGPAHRLGRARADPRRTSHLSSVARRAARDRHSQPLTGVGHEASKRRDRQTGTRSAPTHEKRHRTGVRGVLANRHRTADTPHLAVQGQSVSRKTVAEVPLTGLFFGQARWSARAADRPRRLQVAPQNSSPSPESHAARRRGDRPCRRHSAESRARAPATLGTSRRSRSRGHSRRPTPPRGCPKTARGQPASCQAVYDPEGQPWSRGRIWPTSPYQAA